MLCLLAVPIAPLGLVRAPARPALRVTATSPRGRTFGPALIATFPAEEATIPAVPAIGLDEWANHMDYKAFRKDVHSLGTRLANAQGDADVRHLKKMIRWSNACGIVGMATMWMGGWARWISVLGLSTWTCTRWTMIGHHISHGGYNRQDDPKVGGTGRFTTYGFAVGSALRRVRNVASTASALPASPRA